MQKKHKKERGKNKKKHAEENKTKTKSPHTVHIEFTIVCIMYCS